MTAVSCEARTGGYHDTQCWQPGTEERGGRHLCLGHAGQYDRWVREHTAVENAAHYWRWPRSA